MKIKVTIDSNLINIRQKITSMNMLEQLHHDGKIEIVGSEKLFEEMRNSETAISKANKYRNISEPFILGYSRLGKAYLSCDDKKLPSFTEIAHILFPNNIELSENQSNDVMHLVAHSHSDSDYFITNNTKDFIHGKKTNQNRKENLQNLTRKKLEKISIKTLTPEEVIELYLKAKFQKQKIPKN